MATLAPTLSTAVSAPRWLAAVAVLGALSAASCGSSAVEMTYSLADSCEPPPPAAADAIEQPFQDLPPGLDFFCGEVFPTECVELTGQGYAELTASSDRIVIDFLGDDDRLADRCGEDLGVVIVVVSPEATEIDPALPVFFNGQRIEAQG